MKPDEIMTDDLVDLGDARTETHGSAPVGALDSIDGQKYPLTGIQSDG